METAPVKDGWQIGKGWRWVLVGSLAINLLIAGLVIGAVAGGGPGGRFRNVDLATGPLVMALRDEDRAAIRQALRDADRPRSGTLMAAERQAILAALRSVPFDPAPVATALDGMRLRMGSATDIAQQALIRRIVAMTAEERGAFADRLEQAMRHGSDDRP